MGRRRDFIQMGWWNLEELVSRQLAKQGCREERGRKKRGRKLNSSSDLFRNASENLNSQSGTRRIQGEKQVGERVGGKEGASKINKTRST